MFFFQSCLLPSNRTLDCYGIAFRSLASPKRLNWRIRPNNADGLEEERLPRHYIKNGFNKLITFFKIVSLRPLCSMPFLSSILLFVPLLSVYALACAGITCLRFITKQPLSAIHIRRMTLASSYGEDGGLKVRK